MKRWILLLLPLVLAACTATTPSGQFPSEDMADFGSAPQLVGDIWLNTSAPLGPDDLQGKVVLVDMWTFG